MEAGADLGTFNRDILTAMDIAADRKNLLVECYLRTEGAPSSGQFWSAADAGLSGCLPFAPCFKALCRGTMGATYGRRLGMLLPATLLPSMGGSCSILTLCDVGCRLLGAGDANMISRLLRGNGHLVAALDADGRTALLRSCVGGHLEAARILVEAGADVSSKMTRVRLGPRML